MVNLERSLLKNLITTDERFARSVNLKFDFYDDSNLPNYKFTRKSVELLENIVDSTRGENKDRSWSIIGPYGSGKSIFSLLFMKLLCKSNSDWIDRSLENLNVLAPEFLQFIESETFDATSGYIPVIVQGTNDSLDISLCSSLLDATYLKDGNPSWASDQFRNSIEVAIDTLSTGIQGSQLTIDLYKKAILLAKAQGYKGLVVAIDEFGKFLENAAWKGSVSEIISSQYLAELASNSAEPDLMYFTIQHQGMGNYMRSLNEQQTNEWAKIQGRFRQVEFTQDEDGLYQLISSSLTRSDDVPIKNLTDWQTRVWNQATKIPLFNGSTESKSWTDILSSVYPFHPISLFALPRLSRTISQNERTLFSFLGSDDPLGLKNFLEKTSVEGGVLPSLTTDYLYDYFVSGISYLTLTPELQKTVAETENALDRISDSNTFETRLIKTIGVISLLRSPIISTKEALIAALDIGTPEEIENLSESLEHLVSRKIVVYRKYAKEYRLWQGSDFDFETHIASAREEISDELDIPYLIKQELDIQPIPVRRHSIETGARRHFDIQFVTSYIEPNPPDSARAGDILYYLPSTQTEIDKTVKEIKKTKIQNTLSVIPKEPVNVNELTLELASLRKVLRDQVELQDDPVALKEMVGRIQATEALLRDDIQEIIEPSLGKSEWYYRGEIKRISSRRLLQELLSEICDRIYSRTPVVPNELINREALSGPMKTGLKKLLQGILNNSSQFELGLTGNGPDVSVYRSVVRKNGLHKSLKNGSSKLVKPSKDTDSGLKSVWGVIEKYLKSADEEPLDFKTLYQEIAEPPFGVKSGLAPLLIWLVMQYNRNSLSIYESGTFQREWNPELLDRFIKAEEKPKESKSTFTIRWLGSKDKSTNALLDKLNDSIPHNETVTDTTISSFLVNLFEWYQSVPTYSRRTYDLSENAKQVRTAITSASDPINLIFHDLPSALSISKERLGNAEKLSESKYEALLESALSEIDDSYKTLIDNIISDMCLMFRCVVDKTDTSGSKVDKLMAFFDSLDDSLTIYVRDPLVKAFLLRAVVQPDTSDPEDPENSTKRRIWIETLSSGLGNQPPVYWTDYEYEEFKDKLAVVASSLVDARKRQYATQSFTGITNSNMIRVLLDINGEEHLDEIYADQGDSKEIQEIVDKLSEQIDTDLANIDVSRRREIIARVLGRLSGGDADDNGTKS